MQDYSLIESLLAGVFSSSVGYTEQEAIARLRKDISTNPEFRAGFEAELREAFLDRRLSWRDLLAEHDVCLLDTEDQAANYARKMLWNVAFGDA